MYKRILCPIDGSPISIRGVQEAVALAKNQAAELKFVHVIDTYFPIIDGVGNYMPVDISEVLEENAGKVIEEASLIAKDAGIHAQSHIVKVAGDRPSIGIINETKEWSADIIVMGTHGLRGFNRMVMGSDAENVVRTSLVPVLLVKNDQ